MTGNREGVPPSCCRTVPGLDVSITSFVPGLGWHIMSTTAPPMTTTGAHAPSPSPSAAFLGLRVAFCFFAGASAAACAVAGLSVAAEEKLRAGWPGGRWNARRAPPGVVKGLRALCASGAVRCRSLRSVAKSTAIPEATRALLRTNAMFAVRDAPFVSSFTR